MPVEIRELVIKTEIKSGEDYRPASQITHLDLQQLKVELLEDCKRILSNANKKTNYKR